MCTTDGIIYEVLINAFIRRISKPRHLDDVNISSIVIQQFKSVAAAAVNTHIMTIQRIIPKEAAYQIKQSV